MTSSQQPTDDGRPSSSGSPSRPLDGRRDGAHWTKRQTHPVGRGAIGHAPLPNLLLYSDTPRYDLTTVAEFVGVRPVTLYSWEQNLGVPPRDITGDPTTNARYSERDLMALVWLREQVVTGVDPQLAADALRENMIAIKGQSPIPGAHPFAQPPAAAYNTTNPPSQPMPRSGQSQPIQRPTPSQPMPRTGQSQPIQRPTPSQPYPGGAPVGMGSVGGQVVLNDLVLPLTRALQLLDVYNASGIMDQAFSSHPVNDVCQILIASAMARVTEQTQRREMSRPELLFALNFFKSRLFRIFDTTPIMPEAPLTFIACGPDESHEIDALLLAVFWRRSGLRVIYFGQEVDAEDLVVEARLHAPRLLALTLQSTARLKLVRRLANNLRHLHKDHPPKLVLVGQALARHPELRQRSGGIFLGATAGEATQNVAAFLRN